jgi:hypothetical protein
MLKDVLMDAHQSYANDTSDDAKPYHSKYALPTFTGAHRRQALGVETVVTVVQLAHVHHAAQQ